MARSRRRRIGLLLVGSVLVSSCYIATHYDGWRYRGGRLIDNGILSRPRYEAQFADVPFNVPGTYTFTFSRFPGTDAVVMLSTPSEPAEKSIQELATQVRLRVVDQNGHVHCDAGGSPRGIGDKRLVVTSSRGVLGLWHTSCVHLELSVCNPCQLNVSVGAVDPATPELLLVPTVQGGGVELP